MPLSQGKEFVAVLVARLPASLGLSCDAVPRNFWPRASDLQLGLSDLRCLTQSNVEELFLVETDGEKQAHTTGRKGNRTAELSA